MTTTFATQPGPVNNSDPTDVMGKRIGAWIIDALLFLVVAGFALGLTGEYKQIADGYDGDEKEFCQDLLDANSDFEGNCISPPFGDRVYLIEYSDTLIYSSIIAAWTIINLVILQGATGASVGKRVLGLRVVNQQGAIAGVGKSIVRTLAWIVDLLPGVPLVGGIAAVTSNGHRRVGDIVASTYVVGTNSVGYPVHVPAASVPAGAQAWGAAPTGPPAQPQQWAQPQSAAPQWEQPQPVAPQWDQPAGWAQPEPAPDPTEVYGVPATAPAQDPPAGDPTVVDAPAMEPDAAEPMPESAIEAEAPVEAEPEPDVEPQPEPEAQPDVDNGAEAPGAEHEAPAMEQPSFDPTATIAGAHAPWSAAAPDPTPAPTQAQPVSEPQWDEARGTYIQWDAARGSWVQWDSTANAWVAIS